MSMIGDTYLQPNEERDHIEVSPVSGMITQEIASNIDKHGGFALIADYGHHGEKEDTFRVSFLSELFFSFASVLRTILNFVISDR